MKLKFSKETRKRLGAGLPSKLLVSDFIEVQSLDVRKILKPRVKLPFSLWFYDQDKIYKYVDTQNYHSDHLLRLKELNAKYPQFKTYVSRKDKVVFDKYLEICLKAIEKKRAGNDPIKAEALKKIDAIQKKASKVLISIAEDNLTPEMAFYCKGLAKEALSKTLDNNQIASIFDQLVKMDGGYLNHAMGVSLFSTAIAKTLGLPEEQIQLISLGALLHDIGKFKLPGNLIKPNITLSAQNQKIFESHTYYGTEMLEDLRAGGMRIDTEVEVIVYQHHEHFNGTGYPNQLEGRQEEEGNKGIHLFARIVGLADQFVQNLEGQYNKTKTTDKLQAIRCILNKKGIYDPHLLKILNEILGTGLDLSDSSNIVQIEKKQLEEIY